ncbi:MAG: hypothetical protein GY816_05940 [Cytophagales bacterium]|nr:hypothetical protein [Cytophagales bacterium]
MLDNIKRRRFDEAIRDHVLSTSFYNEDLTKSVRYALESMIEIDSSYAYKVYANSRKIIESVGKELGNIGINSALRYQGALRTDTHIRIYGELDILCILEDTASHKEVYSLGQTIRDNTSKLKLQSTDYGDGVRIRLITEKPVCKINIIPCSWINNPQYAKTKSEIYHAIVVYNFKDKTRKKYLPFLNMARVNAKDIATNGAYKKLVRLLRSICTDDSILLDAYEIAGLCYRIEDNILVQDDKRPLSFLPGVFDYFKSLLAEADGLEVLLSPSEKELVFGKNPDRKTAVTKLMSSFQGLIDNLNESIGENLDAEIETSSDSPADSKTE